ncbi:hypothetical protein [Rhizobium sp. P32RR-XVIII]|uniref:hypothetical protein n=1 Tax=Rhizobium sp. P32RR-XVIII TaxID=2726738 RepID=UPI001FEF29FE|nr:hypothetical protein [Rhizobium sp. P32RR-XVIII]
MIRSKIAQMQIVMSTEDVALCQRVYDHVCAVRQVKSAIDREELATRVIRSFRHGVKNEDDLRRLVSDG